MIIYKKIANNVLSNVLLAHHKKNAIYVREIGTINQLAIVRLATLMMDFQRAVKNVHLNVPPVQTLMHVLNVSVIESIFQIVFAVMEVLMITFL